ncbi:MAG: carbohydrate kinase [Acutalibacteraceae bacterium]|nr:carbohydrate kinase [Acutalibacteraceae bacterium]
MKVLSFGEIIWDVYPDEKHLGGAPLNFAAHFAKQGGEAYVLSALGDDELGNEALNKLSFWKVNAEYVSVLSGKDTGKCLVTLDKQGVPTYNIVRDSAYDYINCSSVSDEFDALYFGTLALRNEYNRREISELIKSHSFKEIFVDVNLREPFINRESLMLCMENATVLKISDEELSAVSKILYNTEYDYKNIATEISKTFQNIKFIIITLGEKGSYAYDVHNKTSFSCAAERVKVASTVGAGDSFSAVFLYKYMCGFDIDSCLKSASRISAYVVSKTEAVPEYDPDSL